MHPKRSTKIIVKGFSNRKFRNEEFKGGDVMDSSFFNISKFSR
jgi:hypothetical protein